MSHWKSPFLLPATTLCRAAFDASGLLAWTRAMRAGGRKFLGCRDLTHWLPSAVHKATVIILQKKEYRGADWHTRYGRTSYFLRGLGRACKASRSSLLNCAVVWTLLRTIRFVGAFLKLWRSTDTSKPRCLNPLRFLLNQLAIFSGLFVTPSSSGVARTVYDTRTPAGLTQWEYSIRESPQTVGLERCGGSTPGTSNCLCDTVESRPALCSCTEKTPSKQHPAGCGKQLFNERGYFNSIAKQQGKGPLPSIL